MTPTMATPLVTAASSIVVRYKTPYSASNGLCSVSTGRAPPPDYLPGRVRIVLGPGRAGEVAAILLRRLPARRREASTIWSSCRCTARLS